MARRPLTDRLILQLLELSESGVGRLVAPDAPALRTARRFAEVIADLGSGAVATEKVVGLLQVAKVGSHQPSARL